MTFDVDMDRIEAVRPVINRHVRRTPWIRSDRLSAITGAEVHVKCEGLQVTGSFKVRGAVAALAGLAEDERSTGVVASSAGNHGLGLAWAGRRFRIPVTVVVPRGTPRVKMAGMEAYGASVVVSPHAGYDDTQTWTLQRRDRFPGRFVSPFEDPAVVAGNGGTLALEIFEEASDLETLVVPCGGGGCVAGAAVAARAVSPGTRIVAVNTEASPGMWRSFRDGRPHLRVESGPTVAEGLEGGVGEHTFRLARRLMAEVVMVQEATVRRAVAEVACQERLVVEGAGAAGVAALLEGRVKGRRIGVVLTGSNIDPARLGMLLKDEMGSTGGS